MRKSNFETTLGDFYENMGYDVDLLTKIETAKAVAKHKVDKRSIFEAFVFPICAYWEIFVEDLLIDCPNNDYCVTMPIIRSMKPITPIPSLTLLLRVT